MSTVRVVTPRYSDEELALQTSLYIALRRASGRVIDLVWFRQNPECARAVLEYADTMTDRDVKESARRLRLTQLNEITASRS